MYLMNNRVTLKMGHPIPTKWPPYERDKWYKMNVDYYSTLIGPLDCTNYMWSEVKCFEGGFLFRWFYKNLNCVYPVGMPYPPEVSQFLTYISGPYDTEAECNAA